MKRPIVILLLASLVISARAQGTANKWKAIAEDMLSISSVDNEYYYLIANPDPKNNVVFYTVLEFTETLCKRKIVTNPVAVSTFKVNETIIAADGSCLDGVRILHPADYPGRYFLKQELESGRTVVIETDTGAKIHYLGAPPPELAAKIVAAKRPQ